MKLDEYQKKARSTAIYSSQLVYPTLGLCGEVGEVINACRFRKTNDIPKEIGDLEWYIANVATDSLLKLSEVCEEEAFDFDAFNAWSWEEACEELTVECSIVAENVKKTIRDNYGVLTDDRRKNVRQALKRAMQALSAIANDWGYGLEECAEMNLDKLFSRKERGKLKGDGDNR